MTTTRKKPAEKQIAKQAGKGFSSADIHRLEFHRHGLALFPAPEDKRPGIAVLVEDEKSGLRQRFCSCSVYKKRTCTHVQRLTKLARTLTERLDGKTPVEDFRPSIWYRLAEILSDKCRERPDTVVTMEVLDRNGGHVTRVIDASGEEMVRSYLKGPARVRFMERCVGTSDRDAVPNRGMILDRLALMTLTENERLMRERGFKTRRQVLEGSFWYRMAYHGYREFGREGCAFYPAIEENTGAFTVGVRDSNGEMLFRMVIPRHKVRSLLRTFQDLLPNQHHFAIHPVPLKSIFKVSPNTQLDLEVRPLIQLIQENGETRFFEREDLEKFRYGNLIYIKEMGLLAELEPEGLTQRKFQAPVRMVLKKSQVPSFFEEFGHEADGSSALVDEDLRPLRMIRTFDRLKITPASLGRDWCWLSADYGFGNRSISLAEILGAKKEGLRYIGTAGGWIDCESAEFDGLTPILHRFKEDPVSGEAGNIGLSRMDLLRVYAGAGRPVDISGDNDDTDLFRKMVELKPGRDLPRLKGLASSLRPYQERGVEWLHFLFENGFGGLLCDDMGLGKTHEVMAFMVGLQEREEACGPFLVVCPTTVLSHWDHKIRAHAPTLRPVIYHGSERDLEAAVDAGDVLLTSYGILRRDIERLKNIAFGGAFFDEIQNLKNPETLAYQAAKEIKAPVKLGLTGTPIENRLMELKALFDLTLPGYLGTDRDFENDFVKPIETDPASPRAEALGRLISPFSLRRRKETVLNDLPPKIEDLRNCLLSEDQVKLYRDAIASRGGGLLRSLQNEGETIPYIHIFALLNLLKQICNHPCLMNGQANDYDKLESGKWELFKEILAEALDSGQKVVVYSQFIGMISIMELFLKELGVGFVALTGKSRNRGEIIARFNDDPGCRVYLGSLKAGGVGIDLVAASVVIHYDMWWNAAREDQATDRVHRIGQRRGVHVFKLVTEGTLEEKIAAVIQRKRNLMDSVVKESDPDLLKTFSRQELIDLLTPP
ncbi:MAG: DEAD/DEAH box helicase [Deltaproteobacteria bacterium]|nr:DEAD/DEAH box helicase [Deltaproteobacteria bacterium]